MEATSYFSFFGSATDNDDKPHLVSLYYDPSDEDDLFKITGLHKPGADSPVNIEEPYFSLDFGHFEKDCSIVSIQ